mmetsp:Transcript_37206/g.71530  ORF Transcript_37206/g.71530 Transcript_37206/m.71530 type:complete len:670 (-) Transcript_37206:184-2193(-)
MAMHAWEETEEDDKDEEHSRDGNRGGMLATSGMGVFPDSSKMKEKLREQMLRPRYHVHDLYAKKGFAQCLARQDYFEKVTLLVIACNAIWIGVDTDQNSANILLDAQPLYQIIEHCFCIFFAFEWTIRFSAFKDKKTAFRDAWFAFDSLLVVFLVTETWVMSAIVLLMGEGTTIGKISILRMARLLRLSRMARMVRLFRAMPELLILIKGLAASLRSVVFTLIMLLSIVYVFAIAFKQLCDGAECETEFSSVLETIHRLWLHGALMDNIQELTDSLEKEGFFMLVLFYIYLLLTALTMMNMLIGVICEVVSAVAATEKEALMLAHVRDQMRTIVATGDRNEDREISKTEFLELLQKKKAADILQDVGVDVIGLVDVADTIFEARPEDAGEDRNLSFAEFMNLVLDLRGSNTATLKDITDLRRHMNSRFSHLEHKIIEHLSVALRRSITFQRCRPDDDESSASPDDASPHLGFLPRTVIAGVPQEHKKTSNRSSASPQSVPVRIIKKGSHDSSNLPLLGDQSLAALNYELQCAKQEISKYRNSVCQQTTHDARTGATFSPQACIAAVPGASICSDGTIAVDLDEELAWVPFAKDSATAAGELPLQDSSSCPGGSNCRSRTSSDSIAPTATDARSGAHGPSAFMGLPRAAGEPILTADGRGNSRDSSRFAA